MGGAETGPGPWRLARVEAIRTESHRVKTFRLVLDPPLGHRAGQHVIVRLTAPDGYQASRSYSVASSPLDGDGFELSVERLDDGEVSSFLHDVVVVGDELEVRGPIGGFFVWEPGIPALAIGGGSGVVPLMSMLRLARHSGEPTRFHLVVSVRSPAELPFGDELPGPDASVVYTRTAPPDAVRAVGRLRAEDLVALLAPDLTVYVCGSAGFADAASRLCVELGVPVGDIRVERFGPSG